MGAWAARPGISAWTAGVPVRQRIVLQWPRAAQPVATDPLILDHVDKHEAAQPDRIHRTQPIGGGRVINRCRAEVLDQARRMAAHLQK